MLLVETCQLYRIDADMLRFELHLLAVAPQLISSVASDLHGTVGRRHLLNVSDELFEGLEDQLPRDMLRRIGVVDLVLHVVAVCRSAELQRGGVLLGVTLQHFDLLRAAPCAEDEHAGCQRIEGPGMSYLHLLSHGVREEITAVGQRPEAAHAIRLVNSDDLSFNKIHSVAPMN